MILTKRKINSIAFLLVLLLSFCSTDNNLFIDKVTSNFDRHSYFLSLKANDKIIFIIENDDLFYYMQKQDGIDQYEYKKEIRNILATKSLIKLDNPNSDFIKLVNVANINADAKKGKDKFIKTYFNNNHTLKDGITDDERTAIIQKLFDWKIASKIDDETGYLLVLSIIEPLGCNFKFSI